MPSNAPKPFGADEPRKNRTIRSDHLPDEEPSPPPASKNPPSKRQPRVWKDDGMNSSLVTVGHPLSDEEESGSPPWHGSPVGHDKRKLHRKRSSSTGRPPEDRSKKPAPTVEKGTNKTLMGGAADHDPSTNKTAPPRKEADSETNVENYGSASVEKSTNEHAAAEKAAPMDESTQGISSKTKSPEPSEDQRAEAAALILNFSQSSGGQNVKTAAVDGATQRAPGKVSFISHLLDWFLCCDLLSNPLFVYFFTSGRRNSTLQGKNTSLM